MKTHISCASMAPRRRAFALPPPPLWLRPLGPTAPCLKGSTPPPPPPYGPPCPPPPMSPSAVRPPLYGSLRLFRPPPIAPPAPTHGAYGAVPPLWPTMPPPTSHQPASSHGFIRPLPLMHHDPQWLHALTPPSPHGLHGTGLPLPPPPCPMGSTPNAHSMLPWLHPKLNLKGSSAGPPAPLLPPMALPLTYGAVP